MKTNRLTPPIVAAIGIVLSLMAIGGIFYFLLKPTQESLTEQQARYDQNYPDSTPIAQKNAQNLLNTNKIKVQQIKFQWVQVESALMPPYDVSDREKAWQQLTYELGHYLAPDLAHQMAVTGFRSQATFALPAPPASANDITAAPLVIPLGTINVHGSFRDILTHFYNWQNFNRLVMVDGLTLDGNSPFMAGSYNATVYEFPQNDDNVGPTNPKAGGAAAGAATPGGFPSGGGGGYPGGGRSGGYPGGGYPGGGRPGG
jgi:hypothetical protein